MCLIGVGLKLLKEGGPPESGSDTLDQQGYLTDPTKPINRIYWENVS